MDRDAILKLLQALHADEVGVDDAMKHLRDLPFSDMGFAKLDHHRSLRKGYPEVIFCQGKSVDQVIAIADEQRRRGETVFGTRASPDVIAAVKQTLPGVQVNESARCFWLTSPSWKKRTDVRGTIVIATAGTADTPVAEEARCALDVLGHPCTAMYDVGVSGIHRLFAHHDELRRASVIIVVAGMEGALPSVVAGTVACPVIGVPTSVGYGSHLGGLVPLFAMLNSCASGLTVVNIDNGFGAACAAAAMNAGGGATEE